jgi:O-antigen ligase
VKKKQTSGSISAFVSFRGLLFFLLCAPCFFLYTNKLADATLLPKFFYASLLIGICGIWMMQKKMPASLFFHPAVLLLLAFALLSLAEVFHGPNVSDGLFVASCNLILPALVLSFSSCFSHTNHGLQKTAFAFSLINFLTCLMAAYGFVEYALQPGATHAQTYRITGTFGHKNILSEIILLTAPWHLMLAKENGLQKKLAYAGFFFSLLMITMLLTRSVWLATIASSGFAFVLFFFFGLRNQLHPPKFPLQTILLFMAALLTGVLVYGFTDSFETLFKQLRSMLGFNYGSGGERIALWKKTWQLSSGSLLLGNGTGSWKTEVLRYGYSGLETQNNLTFHQRPHNDFLWVICENGIPGLFLYAAAFILPLFVSIKNYLKTGSIEYVICIHACISFFILSFFAFPYERMEHKAAMAAALAIPMIRRQHVNQISFLRAKAIGIFLLVLSIMLLFVSYYRIRGEYHLSKAYKFRAEQNWTQVIEQISKAENFLYRIDPTCTPLLWYSGSAWYNLGNTDSAFQDFSEAYVLNPNHVHVLNNLATCYEVKGYHSEAISLYNKALRLSPGFEEARYNLVASYFNANMFLQSLHTFEYLKPDTLNPLFNTIFQAVIKKNLLILADSAAGLPIQNQILAIHNVDAWYRSIYFKSKQTRIPFLLQAIEDAYFSLDKPDKMLSFDWYKRFINKYKPS